MRNQESGFGVVGCGVIGQSILKAADSGQLAVPVTGVFSRTRDRAEAFLSTLKAPPPFLSLEALTARSGLLVEAAGGAMVPPLAQMAFSAGKDLLVISVGALLEHPHLLEEARAHNCRLILPSGAIAGVDGIKSACIGPLARVTITTRKPPKGLAGAPFLVSRGISLEGLTTEKELYHGPVREACLGFPDNVNVSATVSLAGLGPDQTEIRIIAVPGLEHNQHTVDVAGEFGSFTMTIRNTPTENPKTGRLTAMSMVRAIADWADPVRIGS